MNKSGQNFRLFLLAGLVTTCILGGLATWLSIGESMQRLQRESLNSRAHEISSTVASRIGDFVNGLQYLARRPRVISSVMGNVTEIENVRDELRSFDLYDDMVAVRLVDVLGDTILSENLPRRTLAGFEAREETIQPMVEAAFSNDGDPTVRIRYMGHRGLDYFVAAVPILRNGGTEGVLLGTFRLALTEFRGMDNQLVGLTVDQPRTPGQMVKNGYISTSTELAGGQLSMHLLWSLDRFAQERQRMVLTVTGSLLAGLMLAFGGLAWVGQRIILAPQRELEESRTALARSEAKARELAVIAESSLDTITINDADGLVQWANPAFETKWGYAPDEVIGRDGLKLRTGPNTVVDEIRQTFETTGAFIGENIYYTRDGTPVDVIVSLQALPAVGDAPPKFVVICRDITELKRREAELEDARARADAARKEATEARRQLEEAIESLDDAFVFYDAEDRLVIFNQAYRNLLGPAGAFVECGKTFDETALAFASSGVIPSVIGKEAEYVEKLKAERGTEGGVDRVFQSDTGRWIHQRDTRTKSGAVVGLRTDITELKEREAELEEARVKAEVARTEAALAQGQLEEAIETLDDGFVFFDSDDVLITYNAAYKRLLGKGGEHLAPGRSYRQLAMEFALSGIVPDIAGKEEEFVQKMMAMRAAEEGVDKTFLSDTGRWIHQRDQRTPSGAIVGLRIDVTELKTREAELEEARVKAEAANHAKSNFLANMSHEIRTPMNGIIGMCELLNETELNSEQRLCARTINNSAEALLSIINNILDFSKIEAGKQEILREPFSLHNVAYDVARLLHPTANEKNIEICVDYDDTLGEHYIGDLGRVRQILINLVGNAVKFTEEGYVLLSLAPSKQEPGAVAFKIADTGIGIPKHKLERIFQAFEQVDNESTRQHDGTGLGLAITEGLVQAMGGHIRVQSREGLGSRFMFDLPLDVADAPAPQKAEDNAVVEAEVCERLKGKTVLVVDDLEVNRYILEKRLLRLGATPVSVASAEAALDLVLEQSDGAGPQIDLAILDHQMPEIDGEKLLVALSGQTGEPPFPTILYSSMDFSVDSRRLHALGFSAVIVKPASRRALCRAIITALGGSERPATDQRTREDAPPTLEATRAPDRKLKVMAAEDNRTNQLVLQKMMAAFPVELEIFSNGEEILDAYVHRGAELIFMDVSMPVMGGLEATQAIRAHEASTGAARCPIVALTAKAMKHHREECMDAGMDDFLTKPIKKAALGEALARHGTVDLPENIERKRA